MIWCWICVWYRENYLVYQYGTNGQFFRKLYSYTAHVIIIRKQSNLHRCQLRLSLKQKDGFLEIATESNIRTFGRKADTSLLTPDFFLEQTSKARPASSLIIIVIVPVIFSNKLFISVNMKIDKSNPLYIYLNYPPMPL